MYKHDMPIFLDYFSVTVNVLHNNTSSEMLCYHFFIVEIIVESVNLTQMSKQKIIITMMENNYFFLKKVHIKTQSKKKDVLVNFILCSCYHTVPSAIWGEFSKFLLFCNCFTSLQASEIIAKDEKQGKPLLILHEATCHNYLTLTT